MNYIIFIGLAMIGYVMTIIITNQIGILQKEYIGIKYSSFEFSNTERKPYGLNIVIRILFPVCLIIICSGIFYETKNEKLIENIYLISIFYYFIRWIYLIIILQRKELQNWKIEILISIIGVIISFCAYKFFIVETTQIFVSIEELRDGIWIAIITFVFVLLKEFIYKNAYIDNEKENQRKEKYILKKYKYFYDKYGNFILQEDKEIINLVFAIMIYENFNRPWFVRCFENLKCLIFRKATLGIMQVTTSKLISDVESIELGINKIKENYLVNKNKDFKELYRCDVIDQTIFDYNHSYNYVDEVKSIYDVLCNNIIEENFRNTENGKKIVQEYVKKFKENKLCKFIKKYIKKISIMNIMLIFIVMFSKETKAFLIFWFTNEDGVKKELVQDFIMIFLTFLTVLVAVVEIIKTKKEQIRQNRLNTELEKHRLIVADIRSELELLLPGYLLSKIQNFYYDAEKTQIELSVEKMKLLTHQNKMTFNMIYKEDIDQFNKLCSYSIDELIIYTDKTLEKIIFEIISFKKAKKNNNNDLMELKRETITEIIINYIKDSNQYYQKAIADVKKYAYEREQKILEKYK
ncbi:MAG: hypothetical protein IJW20_03500 [Clostridia bacterium]|nr:hypothetical protein [Clostridia bacterium]